MLQLLYRIITSMCENLKEQSAEFTARQPPSVPGPVEAQSDSEHLSTRIDL